ncbi:putative erm, partial [Operophtera brumata]
MLVLDELLLRPRRGGGVRLVFTTVLANAGRGSVANIMQFIIIRQVRGGGGGSAPGPGGRRGALQLWQFLVSLLAEGARCVAWTGRGLEFKLHEPEE